ncbi:MAG: helix-hairpin-helix domain-containing protein [Candidatus Accumulibacter sp.]|jgi:competence protein ComEA|nr:helix-hairpin-helix domain-containing protein [Accumulibacter sp.]
MGTFFGVLVFLAVVGALINNRWGQIAFFLFATGYVFTQSRGFFGGFKWDTALMNIAVMIVIYFLSQKMSTWLRGLIDGARVRMTSNGTNRTEESRTPYREDTTRESTSRHSTENTAASSTSGNLIDVNVADYDELLTLPGIGAAEAKMILAERATGRNFSSLSELSEFLNLKPHKTEQLKGRVTFSGGNTPIRPQKTAGSPTASPGTRSQHGGRVVD